MIRQEGRVFYLETAHTSYLFHILESGHPEHLHYGARLLAGEDGAELSEGTLTLLAEGLREKQLHPPGNAVQYSAETGALCLENLCTEFSSFGKGDIRDPFLEIVCADGNTTADFLYEDATICDGKHQPAALPGATCGEDGGVQELTVRYRERETGLLLALFYAVFPEADTIVRSARLTVPPERDAVILRRLMSAQLDFHETGLRFTSFHGHWADEMGRFDTTVAAGRAVCDELWAGVSGSRANPFVVLSEPDATEESGRCVGVNLVYSGCHYEALSADGFDKSRFLVGIQPDGFSWALSPGESFETPEAVFCCAEAGGFGEMSRRMHRFVRRHIVRGAWRDKPRPVLLNSWEANYFKFDEAKLVRQAKAAKELGIELFVLDDGWFGARDDDTSSLGDWTANGKKLPNGLGGLADRIHALGLQFGLWVEPEMVNERSTLYAKHPAWAVRAPGRAHALGRNQMLLDLTRAEVQDFLIEEMTRVFSEARADYVKWDMNRIFSDRYSAALSPERQGEFAHRYVLGLYRVLRTLTERFPEILFEGCASGGNRFDLGILSFFPQIWASDDTDALCRADIQRGYSYGYPLSTIGAHVSASPNHQTLNQTPLETRFAVAVFGCLGYECDPCDLSGEERELFKRQIAWYKAWREVFFAGDCYRLRDGALLAVSADRTRAAALLVQRENRPNRPFLQLRTRGLAAEKRYRVTNFPVSVGVRDFGSLVNTMSPVHVKEGGVVQAVVSRIVRLPADAENQTLPGAALNACGVRLLPNYGGTGFGEGVRVFRTGDARLILFEEAD